MTALAKLLVVETKLFLREPLAWLTTLLLPSVILVVLGLIPGLRAPDPAFGGQRFIDMFVPSLVVLTLATLGVNILPTQLTAYRERGVLRRMSTTPADPRALLVAQLMIALAVAVCAVVLLIAIGHLAFDVPLPRRPLFFIVTFFLGAGALFALGLLITAVAPTARSASALALVLFLLIMFFGGVYVPRIFLPELVQQIGAYTPPGVPALFAAWMGEAPQPGQLAALAATALAAGGVAARLFRWE
jgi:ABC-2 type transport system permease protein